MLFKEKQRTQYRYIYMYIHVLNVCDDGLGNCLIAVL